MPNYGFFNNKEWQPDSAVTHCPSPSCNAQFGFFTRKHHCRGCGGIFCSECLNESKSFKYLCKGCKEIDDGYRSSFANPRGVYAFSGEQDLSQVLDNPVQSMQFSHQGSANNSNALFVSESPQMPAGHSNSVSRGVMSDDMQRQMTLAEIGYQSGMMDAYTFSLIRDVQQKFINQAHREKIMRSHADYSQKYGKDFFVSLETLKNGLRAERYKTYFDIWNRLIIDEYTPSGFQKIMRSTVNGEIGGKFTELRVRYPDNQPATSYDHLVFQYFSTFYEAIRNWSGVETVRVGSLDSIGSHSSHQQESFVRHVSSTSLSVRGSARNVTSNMQSATTRLHSLMDIGSNSNDISYHLMEYCNVCDEQTALYNKGTAFSEGARSSFLRAENSVLMYLVNNWMAFLTTDLARFQGEPLIIDYIRNAKITGRLHQQVAYSGDSARIEFFYLAYRLFWKICGVPNKQIAVSDGWGFISHQHKYKAQDYTYLSSIINAYCNSKICQAMVALSGYILEKSLSTNHFFSVLTQHNMIVRVKEAQFSEDSLRLLFDGLFPEGEWVEPQLKVNLSKEIREVLPSNS